MACSMSSGIHSHGPGSCSSLSTEPEGPTARVRYDKNQSQALIQIKGKARKAPGETGTHRDGRRSTDFPLPSLPC